MDIIFDLETSVVRPGKAVLEDFIQSSLNDASKAKIPVNYRSEEAISKWKAGRNKVLEDIKFNALGAFIEENKFNFAFIDVVSIGMALVEDGKIKGHEVKSGRGVVTSWNDMIASLKTKASQSSQKLPLRMIGYNIVGFDKPALISSCMRHKVQLVPRLGNGYNDWLDLFFVMKKGSLKHYVQALGLDSYGEDEHGSQVDKLVNQEDWDRISRYCLKDVLNTAEIFIRMQKVLVI
jgi:hypothetical protein